MTHSEKQTTSDLRPRLLKLFTQLPISPQEQVKMVQPMKSMSEPEKIEFAAVLVHKLETEYGLTPTEQTAPESKE